MKLWTELRRWWQKLGNQEPTLLDHVLVPHKGVAAKKIARARAHARARHGKQLHCDDLHPRETPPSRDLQDLLSVAEEPHSNVSNLKKARS